MTVQLFKPRKKYYLNAAELTTKELGESSLNNLRLNSISSALVEFKSPAGITYYADHTRDISSGLGIFLLGLPATSYIELFCRKKEFNEEDFAFVESILESIAKQKLKGVQLGSRFDRLAEDSDYGPIRFIDIRYNVLTNYRIAELVEEYDKYFDNVRILRAFFQNVRKSDIRHLDLSLEKVSIRDTRHLHPDDWKNPLL